MNIAIISSSMREGRTSHRVALALMNSILKRNHQAFIIDLKETRLPVFEERIQFLKNPHENILKISAQLQSADAIIFVTPEYNGSFSSALKNMIETFGKNEYNGKAMGVATVSTGIMGGMRAAQQLQQVILAIHGYPQPQMLLTAEVTKQLDESGGLINAEYQKKLDVFLEAFLGFASKLLS